MSAKLSDEEIRMRLERVEDLPTLPEVADSITRVILDEDSSAADIAAIVSKDPAFASKILKVVNSAYYGFYRQINSIREAVSLLGFDEVKLMAMAISVLDLYKPKEANHLDRRKLWIHGVAVAYMADYLQRQLATRVQEAYIAGLLHDLGKFVIDQYFPEETEEMIDLFETQGITALEAEREIFGLDHGEIGYLLAEKWNLPVPVSMSIRYHHALHGEIMVTPLAAMVYLSDYFTWKIGYVGSPFDPPKGEHLGEALKALGLTDKDFERFCGFLKEGFKRLEVFLATC